ncbi:MAG: hypothetical protein K0U29_00605 [Gammaproteobacteria bacterium]|nr:hypothetical protein [Gammaproteobacteria bacterium]MCH9743407.1 hypothetical protein [Gammaproteobacteria bacterium]
MKKTVMLVLLMVCVSVSAFATNVYNTPIKFIVRDRSSQSVYGGAALLVGIPSEDLNIRKSDNNKIAVLTANTSGPALRHAVNRGEIGLQVRNFSSWICSVFTPISLLAGADGRPQTFSMGSGAVPPVEVDSLDPDFKCIAKHSGRNRIIVKVFSVT